MKHTYLIILMLIFSFNVSSSESWEKLNGPAGGKVVDLTKGDGVVLALLKNDFQSSVYISTDEAQSWELILAKWEQSSQFLSIEYHQNSIFVGTINNGVLKSTDNGKTWEESNSGLNNDIMSIGSVTNILSFNNDLIIGTMLGNVFISNDNGDNWSKIEGLPKSRITAMESLKGDIYIGVNSEGVWRSTNSGNSWEEFNTGLDLSNSIIINIKSLGGKLFAFGGNLNCVLNENSNIWEKIEGLEFPKKVIGFDGENYFIPAFKKMFRSKDLQNWDELNTVNEYGEATVFLKTENSFLVGHSLLGVFKTTDKGENWVESSSGLTSTFIKSILINDDKIYSSWIMSDFGIPYRSNDLGESWDKIDNGISAIGTVDILNVGDHLFAATEGSGVFRSSNNGDSWERKSTGIISNYLSKLAATDNYIFAGTVGFTQGVFKSSNNGESWETVDNLPKDNTNEIIYDSNTKRLYASVENRNGVFVSSDEGENWSKIFDPSEFNDTWVGCMDVKDSLVVIGTFGEGLYISENGIDNFREIQGKFSEFSITEVKIIEDYIMLGTRDGSFYKVNYRSNEWENISKGLLGNVYTTDIAYNDGVMYIGTNGLGIWRYDISDLTNINFTEKNSDNLKFDIYPNPFKNSVKLRLKSNISSNINITVNDILGNNILRLNEYISSSELKEISLDLNSIETGVYIINVKLEDNIISKKLLKVE